MSDLNDYLDGRLGPEEREAFERRLENDPELGRRLEAAHEVRAALRSGDEELSPGFYTRAVARFEESRRPRTRLPFGLTWSTAGLAAAGLAAAAIFIPLMLRDEIPMPEKAAAPTEQLDVADAPESLEEEVGDESQEFARLEKKKESAPKSQAVEPADTGAPATDDDALVDQVAAREDFAPTPPARVELEENKNVALSEPRRDVRKRDKLAHPPPPRVQQPAEPEPAVVDEGLFQNNYQATVSGVTSAGAKVQQGAVGTTKGLAAATLPDDTAPPGVVWISESDAETPWKSADSPGVFRLSGDTARARETSPPDRFLVVGKRRGLDRCDELRLKAHESHWEVSFDEAGSAEGAVTCGLLIPADGREIRFMGKRVDE